MPKQKFDTTTPVASGVYVLVPIDKGQNHTSATTSWDYDGTPRFASWKELLRVLDADAYEGGTYQLWLIPVPTNTPQLLGIISPQRPTIRFKPIN